MESNRTGKILSREELIKRFKGVVLCVNPFTPNVTSYKVGNNTVVRTSISKFHPNILMVSIEVVKVSETGTWGDVISSESSFETYVLSAFRREEVLEDVEARITSILEEAKP